MARPLVLNLQDVAGLTLYAGVDQHEIALQDPAGRRVGLDQVGGHGAARVEAVQPEVAVGRGVLVLLADRGREAVAGAALVEVGQVGPAADQADPQRRLDDDHSSRSAHMTACTIAMCASSTSCMFSERTTRQSCARPASRPPAKPAAPKVAAPRAFATSTARRTFCELPEPETAMTRSPGRTRASSCAANTSP